MLTPAMIVLVLAVLAIASVVANPPAEDLFTHHSGKDCHLTQDEFTSIFMDMDRQNVDHRVSLQEFKSGWHNDDLANEDESSFYFSIVDVDNDGFVTTTDLHYLFHIFLTNSNHNTYINKDDFMKSWKAVFEP